MDDKPFCNNYTADLICRTVDGRFEFSISASTEMGTSEAKMAEIADIDAVHIEGGKIIVEKRSGCRVEVPDRQTLARDLSAADGAGFHWSHRAADFAQLEAQALHIVSAASAPVIFDPMGERSDAATALFEAAKVGHAVYTSPN